jgi:uncharacterized membrane protein
LAADAQQQPRWPALVTFPLVLLGLADSIYLTITHFDKAALVCHASGHINCELVTQSKYSEIFGHIPVAIAGLAYFVVLTVLCSPWVWRIRNLMIDRIRLALLVIGMGMVAYLLTAEVHLKAICLYCTGVHIITFFLFLTTLAAYLLRPIDD